MQQSNHEKSLTGRCWETISLICVSFTRFKVSYYFWFSDFTVSVRCICEFLCITALPEMVLRRFLYLPFYQMPSMVVTQELIWILLTLSLIFCCVVYNAHTKSLILIIRRNSSSYYLFWVLLWFPMNGSGPTQNGN